MVVFMVLSKILAKVERMEIYMKISKGKDFPFLGTGIWWLVRFYILFLLCLLEFSTVLGLMKLITERLIGRDGCCNSPVWLVF